MLSTLLENLFSGGGGTGADTGVSKCPLEEFESICRRDPLVRDCFERPKCQQFNQLQNNHLAVITEDTVTEFKLTPFEEYDRFIWARSKNDDARGRGELRHSTSCADLTIRNPMENMFVGRDDHKCDSSYGKVFREFFGKKEKKKMKKASKIPVIHRRTHGVLAKTNLLENEPPQLEMSKDSKIPRVLLRTRSLTTEKEERSRLKQSPRPSSASSMQQYRTNRALTKKPTVPITFLSCTTLKIENILYSHPPRGGGIQQLEEDALRQLERIDEAGERSSSEKVLLSPKKTCRIVLKLPEPLRQVDFPTSPFFRTFRLGDEGTGVRIRGEPQDFYELRDQHLRSGTLFEDPDFPAEDSSLNYSRRPDRHYEWLRPGEIVDNPQLFVEGYSRFDVQQGELGDCWLLAAVANLTLYRRLFFQIVPDDQGFDDKYAGIFHFRFWQYGKWIDVVVDDRLPTYRGQLIYLRSNEDNEFWSALLEKAYAKLNGSYEALRGGSACEAMEDFTGGVTEMYELNATPPNLFKILLKAYERGSLMSGSLEPDPHVLEAHTPDGLIRGHAYSITRVKYVDIQTPHVTGKIPLLRLRNPWGNEDEWTGPWGDNSPEWQYIPEHEKQELGLTFDHDGEFWMSYKDFETHFSRLEICNLTPDSLTDEEIERGHKKQWEMSAFEGEWVRGSTAGGCRNSLETFWQNPQYRVTLTDADEDDEEGKCTLIVALMQKHRRASKLAAGVEFLTIGFAIYNLADPNRVPKPLDLDYFKYHTSVARSPSFINLREVSCRFRLPPGTYCIIPSTFDPNEEGEFLLRVFSESRNVMEEHDESLALGAKDDAVVNRSTGGSEIKETDQTRQLFLKLAGEDMVVDWSELKDVLDYALKNETGGRGFSKEACRTLIALVDADRSGKLEYREFIQLWSDVLEWRAAFTMHDSDHDGSLAGIELRQALNSAGYRLSSRLVNILMRRYGSDKHDKLMFDDFVVCALKLRTMIGIFKAKESKGNADKAEFGLEEWIETTLYA